MEVWRKMKRVLCFALLGLALTGSVCMSVRADTKSSESKVTKTKDSPSQKSKKIFVITEKKGGERVKSLSLAKGKNKKLHVSQEADKNEVSWTSSRPKVCEVKKSGRIYGLKNGKATITAKYKNKKKASVTVRVYKEIEPKKIKISAKKKKCYIGECISLETQISPAKATKKEIKWSTSKKRVATVKDGQVYAVGEGSCYITASIVDTKIKKKIRIKVIKKKVLVTGITTSYQNQNITMEHGRETTLRYQVLPADATKKNVKFKSSVPSIVSVTETGVIRALRPGTASITIRAADGSGVSTTVTITVTGNTGFLTKQMLDEMDLTSIDNLMIVAHPDDETIWGGGHIVEDDYFILCLTDGYNEKRKKEFYKALSASNDKGMILSYPDTIDGKRSDWKNVKNGMLKDLELIMTYKKWDMVVAHNPSGEYGHEQHKMTSQYVTDTYVKKVDETKAGLVYFGKYYAATKVNEALKDEPRLSQRALERKQILCRLYPSQKVMVTRLAHMYPWELWINAQIWQ